MSNDFSFYYNKPAAIIQMFHEALTPKTFAKGLKYYLTAMNTSFPSSEDLYRELQKAFDEDFPRNGIKLDEVMGRWEAGGYPVIFVEKARGKFILTQESVDKVYTIPITYATQSDLILGRKVMKRWMKTKSIEVERKPGESWMILNVNITGFFKVRYSDKIKANLIDTLETNHTLIPKYNRFEMLDGFPNENLLDFRILKLFEFMTHETESFTWMGISKLYYIFHDRVFGSDVFEKFETFIQLLTKPYFDKIGFADLPNESDRTAALRMSLRLLSCESNQPECLKYELDSVDSSFFKTVDEATYMKLLKTMKMEDGEFFPRLVSNLMYTLNGKLLKSFLDKCFLKFEAESLRIMTLVMTKSVKSLEVSLDFIIDNFERIFEK